MSTTIKCETCGSEIEITEAIKKELEIKILAESEAKHKAEIVKIKEEAAASAKKDAEEKAGKDFELKLKISREESESKDKQISDLTNNVAELTKLLRESRGAENKMKIDYETKLLNEQDKIRKEAKKESDEEYILKVAQKNKLVEDLKAQLAVANRKIVQGSQQAQGEALETSLEGLLKKEFPLDDIQEIKKGVNGADTLQTVKTQRGTACGTIYWEAKNTQKWQEGWVQKLLDNQRSIKADIPVLVSTEMPSKIDGFGHHGRVWVSKLRYSIPLAYALRTQLIKEKGARISSENLSSNAEKVYKYLTGKDFTSRVEVLVEYFINRKSEVEKERFYFNKKWEKEEKNIIKVIEATAGMYGDLESIIGPRLPKINHLELPEKIEDEK